MESAQETTDAASGLGRYATRTGARKRVKQTPVQFPPQLVADLDAAAEKHGYDSRSAIIREACKSLLKRLEKRGRPEEIPD